MRWALTIFSYKYTLLFRSTTQYGNADVMMAATSWESEGDPGPSWVGTFDWRLERFSHAHSWFVHGQERLSIISGAAVCAAWVANCSDGETEAILESEVGVVSVWWVSPVSLPLLGNNPQEIWLCSSDCFLPAGTRELGMRLLTVGAKIKFTFCFRTMVVLRYEPSSKTDVEFLLRKRITHRFYGRTLTRL